MFLFSFLRFHALVLLLLALSHRAAAQPPVLPLSETPRFSHTTGTFVEDFKLFLTVSTPDASIRYTTNGAAPIEASFLYEGPIAVTNGLQIRAKSFRAGFAPSATASESFVKLAPAVREFRSTLPVVVIDNFKRGTVSPTVAQPVFFGLFDRVGGYAELSSDPTLVTRAGLRTRGSSTESQTKRNYAVETRDAEDLDRKIEPLGMPADSDWILYAPYNFDRALMRNPFMYELSNQIGRYAVRTRFVELFVNTGGGPVEMADYQGIYVFMEKIKRGDDRVDVARLDREDVAEPEITGGYMLKIDRLDPGDRGFTAGGQQLGFLEPKEKEILNVQSNWVKRFINNFGTTLNNPNSTNPATSYTKYFDVEASIDHHILNEFSKNPDGFVLSTYLHKPRNGKLAFGPIWDFDRTMGCDDDSRAENPVGWSGNFNYNWWGRLFRDPDFYQRYIDRWQELREAHITVTNLFRIIDGMVEELREAQPRDAVKWKMVPNAAGWQGKVTRFKTWVERRVNWIDSQWIPRPAFNQQGGVMQSGFKLAMATGPTNVVYYTLDGTDPRAPGGGLAPGALVGQPGEEIPLSGITEVFARAKNTRSRNPWSAPMRAVFVPPLLPEIAITEVMFNPPAPADASLFDNEDFEYVELFNFGPVRLNLAGMRLRGGIQFTFPSQLIEPGGTFLVVKNRAAFATRYNAGALNIVGEYSGQLSNSGDTLILEDAAGRAVVSFSYRDNGPWPKAADGKGHSLEAHQVRGNLGLASNWHASAELGGSPGESSLLRMEISPAGLGTLAVKLSFRAAPYLGYTLHTSDEPGGGEWLLLKEFPPSPNERLIEHVEPFTAHRWRFFRVTSP